MFTIILCVCVAPSLSELERSRLQEEVDIKVFMTNS